MLRAVVLAARLEFTIDEPILDAIAAHRHEIARSAPARLVEEYYKILRSGHAEEAFRQLPRHGLLKEITPELRRAGGAVASIAALDRYRAAVRGGARLADQRDPRRHAAACRSGSLGRRRRFSRRRARAARRAGHAADRAARHRAAAADPRAAAAAAGHPRADRAPSARCCTARRSTKRSPGWRFTASGRRWSRTGGRCRPRARRRTPHRAAGRHGDRPRRRRRRRRPGRGSRRRQRISRYPGSAMKR